MEGVQRRAVLRARVGIPRSLMRSLSVLWLGCLIRIGIIVSLLYLDGGWKELREEEQGWLYVFVAKYGDVLMNWALVSGTSWLELVNGVYWECYEHSGGVWVATSYWKQHAKRVVTCYCWPGPTLRRKYPRASIMMNKRTAIAYGLQMYRHI